MKGLTKRQREILDYIEEFITSNRYSPSYREISTKFGLSSLGSVHKHIMTLKKKGKLESENNVGRSISLVHAPIPKQNISIPLIGYISAGVPIKTFSQAQEILIPAIFPCVPEKTYALKAQGDSLNEEMICDGDIILVEARHQAQAGETIVALINHHETLIKKYHAENCYIRLTSIHSSHHPLIFHEEDVDIHGVVLGLFRFFPS